MWSSSISFLLDAHVESAGALAGAGCGEFIVDAPFGLWIDAAFAGLAPQSAFDLGIAFKRFCQLVLLGRHPRSASTVALLLKLLSSLAPPTPVTDDTPGPSRQT